MVRGKTQFGPVGPIEPSCLEEAVPDGLISHSTKQLFPTNGAGIIVDSADTRGARRCQEPLECRVGIIHPGGFCAHTMNCLGYLGLFQWTSSAIQWINA